MKSPRYEEFPTIGMTAIIIALVSLVFLVIHDMQENRKLRDACNGVGGY